MKKTLSIALGLLIGLSANAHAVPLTAEHLYTFAHQQNENLLEKYSRYINITNRNNDTALCIAVKRRDRNSFELLKEYGASTKVECFQKMLKKTATGASATGDGTFLGMGATGWTVAGVVAAGAGVAIVAGSGGGGSSHSSGGGTLNCHHGKQVGDSCQCYAGYTGTQCEDKVDCSGYYSICPAGYDKGSNTCQSGEDILYKCDVEKVCPYTTTSCSTGYHETGNTCQSGTKIYVECEANTCTGYDYTTCPTGYAQSDSCLAGDIIKIKCDNCDTGYGKDASDKCVLIKGEDIVGPSSTLSNGVTVNNDETIIINDEYKDVYGIKVTQDIGNTVVNAYTNETVLPSMITIANAKIDITNTNDGDVYGVYSDKKAENASSSSWGTVTGIIDINNVGNGNIYGLYAKDSSAYNVEHKVPNYEHSEGKININNTGNGNVYGILGNDLVYNVYARNTETGIKITNARGSVIINNVGNGDIYGMMATKASSHVYNIYGYSTDARYEKKANGTLYIKNEGKGNVYGLYAKDGYVHNGSLSGYGLGEAHINIINNGGNTFGLYGVSAYNNTYISDKDYEATYRGYTTIANLGDGNTIGLYGTSAVYNSGNVTIHNLGNGIAVGLYVNKGTAQNSGNIKITRADYKDKKATDDTSDDETYTATSAKGGTAIGIYGANGAEITNSGTITIDGADTSYGIYAETGATVTNSGTITIDGTSCTGSNCTSANNAIVLNGGKLFQDGVLQAQSLSLNDFGGEVIANSNAKFVVKDNISGDLAINNNVVQDGFGTTYKIANMVEAGDTSGLNLKSQSALFDAKLENNSDAVMEMKAFNSVVKDESVAEFLQNNYAAQNNEKLYQTLKSSETVASLNSNVDALFGKEMFSRMAFEDISMLREINFDMNQNLFNQPEGYFALGGNISPSNYDSNLGSVGRYSLNGYNDGKRSFAIGMSITDIRTDNGNGANNRFDRSFVMSAPYGYRTDNGFEFITTPKLGFTNGTYRRRGLDGMNYNGNVQKRMVALMNEARYPFDFSKMTLTAALEFNAIGYNIRGDEDEQDYSLRIKSQNHASVETGFGLTASKEVNLTKDSKLKLSGGVAFYHEFANPYELELGMNGMSGTYKMRNDKYGDNRTVVRFGLDYQLQDYLDVTANLLSNIDKETRTDARVDMKYNF